MFKKIFLIIFICCYFTVTYAARLSLDSLNSRVFEDTAYFNEEQFIKKNVDFLVSELNKNQYSSFNSNNNYVFVNYSTGTADLARNSIFQYDATLKSKFVTQYTEQSDNAVFNETHRVKGVDLGLLNEHLNDLNSQLQQQSRYAIIIAGFDNFLWHAFEKKVFAQTVTSPNFSDQVFLKTDIDLVKSHFNKIHEIIIQQVASQINIRIVSINLGAFLYTKAEDYNSVIINPDTQDKGIFGFYDSYGDRSGSHSGSINPHPSALKVYLETYVKQQIPLRPSTEFFKNAADKVYYAINTGVTIYDCEIYTSSNSNGFASENSAGIFSILNGLSDDCLKKIKLSDRLFIFQKLKDENATLSSFMGLDRENLTLRLLKSTPEIDKAGVITKFEANSSAVFKYYYSGIDGDNHKEFFRTLGEWYSTYPIESYFLSAKNNSRIFYFTEAEDFVGDIACGTSVPSSSKSFNFDFDNSTYSGKISETDITYQVVVKPARAQVGGCKITFNEVISSRLPVTLTPFDIVLFIQRTENNLSDGLNFNNFRQTSVEKLKNTKLRVVPAFYLQTLRDESSRELLWQTGYTIVGTAGLITGMTEIAAGVRGLQLFWTSANVLMDAELAYTGGNTAQLKTAVTNSLGAEVWDAYQYLQLVNGIRSLGKMTLSKSKALENIDDIVTKTNTLHAAVTNSTKMGLVPENVQPFVNKLIEYCKKVKPGAITGFTRPAWKNPIIVLAETQINSTKLVEFEKDLDILKPLFTSGLSDANVKKYVELWDFARQQHLPPPGIPGGVTASFRSEEILRLLFKFDAHSDIKKWIATFDNASDAALLNKLDALPPTVYTDLNTNINALKATFEANPGTVKAWEVAFKHADLIRLDVVFLKNLATNLDDFPNLKLDLQDIDVFNAYKEFGSDKVLAYEILNNVDGNLAVLVAQKVQTSTVPSYWKYLVKGKYFERDFLLAKFKTRFPFVNASDEYIRLRDKALTEYAIDLNLYDMYSQVQFNLPSSVTLPSGRILDYFVADQVFIKWGKAEDGITDEIKDMLIIENKLSDATALTPPQNAGKAASSLKVRSQNATNESPVSGIALPKDRSININNKWLKAFDSDNGDILTDIKKL